MGCSKRQDLLWLWSIVNYEQENKRGEKGRFHNCPRMTKMDKHHYRRNTPTRILRKCLNDDLQTSFQESARVQTRVANDRSREREPSKLGYQRGLPIAVADRSREERVPNIQLLP